MKGLQHLPFTSSLARDNNTDHMTSRGGAWTLYSYSGFLSLAWLAKFFARLL